MNCLTHPELIDLVYGEGDRARLRDMHRHLAECPTCMDAYLELKEMLNWIQPRKDPLQVPIPVLLPDRPRFHRAGWVAAAILAVLLGIGMLQQTRTVAAFHALQARLTTMDSRIAQAEYRMDENNRDQYYLLMALKEYADRNLVERRASYEKTR